MTYYAIKEAIPETATLGVASQVSAREYLRLSVVEGLAVKALGYDAGVSPEFNPRCKRFLEDLTIDEVMEDLTQKASLEVSPVGVNFSSPKTAKAYRLEQKTRAMQMISLLRENYSN